MQILFDIKSPMVGDIKCYKINETTGEKEYLGDDPNKVINILCESDEFINLYMGIQKLPKKGAKIKVNENVYELTDCCQWEIRQGVLWNVNTNHDEGVDGDIIEYTICDKVYKGHVVGCTCYQFISTVEWGKVILSAADYNVKFTHNTKVEIASDTETSNKIQL